MPGKRTITYTPNEPICTLPALLEYLRDIETKLPRAQIRINVTFNGKVKKISVEDETT